MIVIGFLKQYDQQMCLINIPWNNILKCISQDKWDTNIDFKSTKQKEEILYCSDCLLYTSKS
jgi:hypothetical protein